MLHYPDGERLRHFADELGMNLTQEEVGPFLDAVRGQLTRFSDFFDDPTIGFPTPMADRTGRAGWPPDNADNIWLWHSAIEPTEGGLLDGRTVGLKDHIPVRGLPLSYGSHVMDTFTADFDAPLVTRLLAAGATIAGKLNMEDFSCGGPGYGGLGDFARVGNPYAPDHLSGGSSSGAGAAVAFGQCDLAIGGDQGGSIRIPAAWCGIVGIKPTHGLVPHTGIVGSDPILDIAGPMAGSVELATRCLAAIAGPDGLDPRAELDAPPVTADSLLAALAGDVAGVRIGVLAEGFAEPIEGPVAESVRRALELLAARGAVLVPVSVASHAAALAPYQILSVMGSRLMLDTHFLALGTRDFFPSRLIKTLDASIGAEMDRIAPLLKLRYLTGSAIYDGFRGSLYAKARNARPWFPAQYDAVLADVDVLALPTTVCVAPEYALPRDHDEALRRTLGLFRLGSYNPVSNTAPFNYTGHPAITVPCGLADGLPVGLQLVGSKYREDQLITVARAYEVASATAGTAMPAPP
jgi:amidase